MRMRFGWNEVEDRFGFAHDAGWFSLCVLGCIVEVWWWSVPDQHLANRRDID